MTFGVDAADEHAVAKKLDRLDKKHGAGTTRLVGRVERDIPNPEITLSTQQDISAWPRMGAKIALAVARLKLPEAYLASNSAVWLRKLLWGDLTATAPPGTGVSKHLAGESVTDPVMRVTNPPPEHQIMLFRLGDGSLGVIFTLFAETRYFIRLGPGSAGPRGVFLLDPVNQVAEWLDWTTWETRIARRIMNAAAAVDADNSDEGDGASGDEAT